MPLMHVDLELERWRISVAIHVGSPGKPAQPGERIPPKVSSSLSDRRGRIGLRWRATKQRLATIAVFAMRLRQSP
jgi:hypothetical protein